MMGNKRLNCFSPTPVGLDCDDNREAVGKTLNPYCWKIANTSLLRIIRRFQAA